MAMERVASRERGFTLIELMIVVVIIGVLAAIAYPSYQGFTRDARRTDAFNALSLLAADMEKFYSGCGAYPENLTATARKCDLPAGAPPGSLGRGALGDQSANQYYVLSITTSQALGAPMSGYLITATAQGTQGADKKCKTLTLTNTGVKASKDSGGAASSGCWKK